MLRKMLITCVLILLSGFECSADLLNNHFGPPELFLNKMLADTVVSGKIKNVPALLAASINAPSPMCNIVAYAPCNYIIPPNDYVNFTINTAINLAGTCTAAQLNTVTLTFEAAPSVPIFVWLSGTVGVTTTSTTPVYMNTAATTISKSTAAMASWFTTDANWTTLCVQAIYSDPPPSALYYPMSCTIVYQ